MFERAGLKNCDMDREGKARIKWIPTFKKPQDDEKKVGYKNYGVNYCQLV